MVAIAFLVPVPQSTPFDLSISARIFSLGLAGYVGGSIQTFTEGSKISFSWQCPTLQENTLHVYDPSGQVVYFGEAGPQNGTFQSRGGSYTFVYWSVEPSDVSITGSVSWTSPLL